MNLVTLRKLIHHELPCLRIIWLKRLPLFLLPCPSPRLPYKDSCVHCEVFLHSYEIFSTGLQAPQGFAGGGLMQAVIGIV